MEINNNLDKSLEYLYSLTTNGIKLGLDRIEKFLNILGNPQNSFKSIHIAGTNGKGTVASTCYSILNSAKYNVGLYTSPHLDKFNERIIISGKQIEDSFIINFVDKYKNVFSELNLTFFEITTAMAFLYFKKHNIDYAVLETGLGGRLDATNVVNPVISIITSISKDHTEFLGNTIKEIAMEKFGIIKSNIPVLSMVTQNELRNILKKNNFVEEIIETCFYSDNLLSTPISKYNNMSFSSKRNVAISNFITGIRAMEIVLNRTLSKLEILNISSLIIPGRLEIVSSLPLLVYDVGHNKDAILELYKMVQSEFSKKNKYIIFSCLKDKDIIGILKNLLLLNSPIFVPNLETSRAYKAKELVDIIKSEGGTSFVLSETDILNQMLDHGFKINNDIIIICGSFYTVSKIRAALNKC